MKISRVILVLLIIQIIFNAQAQNFDKNNNTQLKIIKVHKGKSKQVVTDGIFSIGEWDDALSFPIADNYEIYLKADSEILCIGLKSDKLIGELVCEIRITSNEKEVFLLHVSGALGEGISGFPATTKFDLNNNKYWEANFLKADSLKNEAWIAAGRPLDKYDDIYNKRDGIEFKINRRKFFGNSLKFTMGWIRIEIEGKKIDKKIYNYPEGASLKNTNNWVELILPTTTKLR